MARCNFSVVQQDGEFPPSFMSMVNRPGHHPAVIRIGGGCKHADPEVMQKMVSWILSEFAGATCTVVSGGTAVMAAHFDAEKGRTVLEREGVMITHIPALLKQHGVNVIAASTTPRTEQMQLHEDWGYVCVSGDYTLDFAQDEAVVWQESAAVHATNWIADVERFLVVHKQWKEMGIPCAWLGIEGGQGTYDEAKLYLAAGIPCIFTAGSGRAMDLQLISEYRAGTLTVPAENPNDDPVPVDRKLVRIINFLAPGELNRELRKLNIIPFR